MTTIAWYCKEGVVEGEVELPDREIDTHELNALLNADHARRCKTGGEPWFLFEGSIRGTISHDASGVNIRLHLPDRLPRNAAEYCPVYPIMVLHVQ